jgi:hypothetical protein
MLRKVNSLKTLASYRNQLIYTIGVYGLLSTLLITGFIVSDLRQWIFNTLLWTWIMYSWTLRIRKMPLVKQLSYDEQQFIIRLKDMELIIPFEETRGIGIKTLDGIFELELAQPTQVGKRILFKPSLLYPLNARKIDRQIAKLNDAIKRARRNPPQQASANALHSQY